MKTTRRNKLQKQLLQKNMKNIFTLIALGCLVLIALADSARSQTETATHRARLSPMPVTPQTVALITGGGEVLLRLDGNRLSISGQFAGMSSPATEALIHNGPPGLPGPMLFQLQLQPAAGGNNTGTLSAEVELNEAQLTALQQNALYIQIYSANNPDGELRGWIFPLAHFQNQ